MNSRSLQEKPLIHEPHATQEKLPSHNQVVCLLRSAINTRNWEPKLHGHTILSNFWLCSYRGIFTLWVAATPILYSVLTLRQHRHSDLLLRGVGPREARREVSSPKLFKTPDSLRATALWRRESHKLPARQWLSCCSLKSVTLTAKAESRWLPFVP